MTTVQAFWKILNQTLGKAGKKSPIEPTPRKIQPKGIVIAPKTNKNQAVLSLHEILTSRTSKLKQYPHNQSFVRAYLEYYLPLNFFKFSSVLKNTEKSVELTGKAAFDLGLKWVDFGCGPGTASLAALCFHSDQVREGKTKAGLVEIQLVDQSKHMLVSAEKIIDALAAELGIAVKITTSLTPKYFKFDSLFLANALNEMEEDVMKLMAPWLSPPDDFAETPRNLIMLEPSHRVSSQRLIRFRERLKTSQWTFLAPCTHQGSCPLIRSKHWCHFSEKTNDADLIDLNQSIFKDPRLYLKYSYLVARNPEPLPQATAFAKEDRELFRAIGDWHPAGPGHEGIDLCQPEIKLLMKTGIPQATRLGKGDLPRRGDLVTLSTKTKAHGVKRPGAMVEELKMDDPSWKILPMREEEKFQLPRSKPLPQRTFRKVRDSRR